MIGFEAYFIILKGRVAPVIFNCLKLCQVSTFQRQLMVLQVWYSLGIQNAGAGIMILLLTNCVILGAFT